MKLHRTHDCKICETPCAWCDSCGYAHCFNGHEHQGFEGNQPKIDESEKEMIEDIIKGRGLIKIDSVDKLLEFSKMAGERANDFKKQVEGMTLEQAKEIKEIRKECSWRSLAHQIHDKKWFGDFFPPSNQIAGIELCRKASEILGEEIQ